MKDDKIIQLAKLGGGVFLATLYAVTGMNGVIILLAAFLLGLPIDRFVAARKDD